MTLLTQHRNVLPLLGACMQPDLAALVTPYCPRRGPQRYPHCLLGMRPGTSDTAEAMLVLGQLWRPHPLVSRLVSRAACEFKTSEMLPLCRARRGSLYGMLHSPALEITWAQVAAMCCGAARGMLHLHAHSILHRDLKSGN